jgi:GT2 family glycosyltransferase
MRLTAIVPATDNPPHLARCIAAIRGADDTPDELVVIREHGIAGPAAARNFGAARATGDILVFVDADVLPHRDAFHRIRRAFATDPELVAVFGSYDSEPQGAGVISAFRNLLHHHVHQQSGGPAATFWAGLGAVRREDFERAGAFDADRYRKASIEDIELGMRLSAAGARIRLDPKLLGTHLKEWTLGSMVQTDFSRRGVPWVALMARTGATPSGLNLSFRHRTSAAASVVLVLGLAARRPRVAAGAAIGLLALNASFYALLLRRRGPVQATAGVALHVLHHLTSVCAVPAGLLAQARERRVSRMRP